MWPGDSAPSHCLALLLDSVLDTVISVDFRGIIEYANRGAQDLFG